MRANVQHQQSSEPTNLIQPITWFTNPYAGEFIELNGVFFPPLVHTEGMQGRYLMTRDGGQMFFPDIWHYRDYLAELIRRNAVVPSRALLNRLQLQSQDVVPYHTAFNVRPFPNFAIPFGSEYCHDYDENLADEETAKKIALDMVMPLPERFFSTVPDAITLEKIFVETYHVRLMGKDVFVFCHNHYKLVDDDTLLKMIRGTFSDVIENPPDGGKRTSGICNKVLMEIKMDHTLEIRESDISRTMVAFRNCYFDIATNSFIPITPGYVPEKVVFYSIDANFRFDVANDIHTWYYSTRFFDKYLWDITGGNIKLIHRIWEIIGYIMTQDTYRKCFFAFQGVPNSGKSTLERLLKRLFSPGTVCCLKGMAFSERFALVKLIRKAFCSCSDLPDKAFSELSESIIKQLTGGDEMDSDDKFKDRKSFYYCGKLAFFTNNPITVKSSHPEAFYNRAVAVPFAYEVHPTMTDKEFDALLLREIDAIATKALYIYLMRYGQPDFIGEDEFKVNAIYCQDRWKDPKAGLVFEYVKDCFATDPDGKVFTEEAYRSFLRSTGIAETDLYLNAFSQLFHLAAHELYDSEHGRAAMNPGENYRYCEKGIAFKACS